MTYEDMKDSGVSWIGRIPYGWKIYSLSQISSQVKTKNTLLQESNLLSLSYGKIKRKDIESNTGLLPQSFDGYNIIKSGDIVLRLTDLQNDHTSLRVGQAKEQGIITSAYVTIRPTDTSISSFLYYQLHSYDIKKGFYGMGSGVRQGLTYDEVKRIKVVIPDSESSFAITAYLDERCEEIDAIISEAQASIDDYKRWKASVIYQAVTKGLNPNVEMKNGGNPWIGAIPTYWKSTSIGHFVSIRSGLTLGKQYPAGTELVERPYLRVANVKADRFVFDNVTTIYVTPEEAEKYALHPGELLMTEGGDRDKLGRGTIWNGEITPCLHQNHVFAVTVNEKWMLTKFLEYVIAS